MAKIKLSAIGITNISGKSGGSVFAHNKNGNYVRRLGFATQPQTAKQTLARSIFGVISRMWGGLTQAQREAWKNWGTANPKKDQFGDSRPLSGRQAFISANSNLNSVGLAPISSPSLVRPIFPSVSGFMGAISFGAGGVLTDASVEASMTDGTATMRYILSVAVVSKGADFGTAKNKYVQILTGLASVLDGAAITDELIALGVTQENNVYLKVDFVAVNGQKSSSVTALMTQVVTP